METQHKQCSPLDLASHLNALVAKMLAQLALPTSKAVALESPDTRESQNVVCSGLFLARVLYSLNFLTAAVAGLHPLSFARDSSKRGLVWEDWPRPRSSFQAAHGPESRGCSMAHRGKRERQPW